MHDLNHFQNVIASELRKISFPEQPAELYEPIRYMLQLGGKRIRPAITLMSCEMFGGDLRHAIHPALAIEVFHNFTLLHDDIMDKAPLRRSQPTVHTRWNTDVAILSGDAMFTESCRLMLETDPQVAVSLIKTFLKTSLKVCEGQQWDMSYQTASDISIAQYLKMIELKTAALLAFSLQAGAMVGKASKEDQQHICDFGRNLGIAFQLHDDILDVYGDENKFGKQAGGDIIENKKTFLLLKAIEVAPDDQLEQLRHWISVEKFDKTEKVAAVKKIFEDLNVKDLAEEVMEGYFDQAITALDSISVEADRKIMLRNVAENLMVREY